MWNDPAIVSVDQRLALNNMEPFDEWEEFVLFGSHYFLLIANRSSLMQDGPRPETPEETPRDGADKPYSGILMARSDAISKSNIRRFGASFPLSPETLGHHGGLGPQSRISSTDVYVFPGREPMNPPDIAGIEPRMCHTITACDHGSLLAGGRTSPDHALRDCWLLREARWERVDDLPNPLYRHCATQVTLKTEDRGILIYGGKTHGNDISDRWLLWRASVGWVEVIPNDSELRPRFGAAMGSIGLANGILVGGMTGDGTILNEFWEWTLDTEEAIPTIELNKARTSWRGTKHIIGKMGACLTMSPIGLLLIGGVSSSALDQDGDIIWLSRESCNDKPTAEWQWTLIDSRTSGQRPLLVGHTTFASHDFVTVVGGGAVCFSFGTYWNTEIITLSTSNVRGFSAANTDDLKSEPASRKQPVDVLTNQGISAQPVPSHSNNIAMAKFHLKSSKEFEGVLNQRCPVILNATDLGTCTREWTLDTLKAKVGCDRTVSLEIDDIPQPADNRRLWYMRPPIRRWISRIRISNTARRASVSSLMRWLKAQGSI